MVENIRKVIHPLGIKGFTGNLTAKELKKFYRQAVKTAHPDRGGSSEKFHLVKKSYEYLKGILERGDEIIITSETYGVPRAPTSKSVNKNLANVGSVFDYQKNGERTNIFSLFKQRRVK